MFINRSKFQVLLITDIKVIGQNVLRHAIVMVIGVGSDCKASMHYLNNRKPVIHSFIILDLCHFFLKTVAAGCSLGQ